MKTAFLVPLILALTGLASAGDLEDYAKAYQLAMQSHRPFLIYVTMDGCPACLQVRPLLPRLARRGILVTVNATRAPVLARRLLRGAASVPRLLVYRWRKGAWWRRCYVGSDAIRRFSITPDRPTLAPPQKKTSAVEPLHWTRVPYVAMIATVPCRSASYRDIMAHVGAPKMFGDFCTTAHENLHQINSEVRNRFGGWEVCNAVYVPGKGALVIQQPNIRLSQIARYVPGSLRGTSFDYLQAGEWENQSLYVLDEWSAYQAGLSVGIELNDAQVSDVQHALDFMVYAWTLLAVTEARHPNYDRQQLSAATQYMTKRTAQLCARYKQQNPGEYVQCKSCVNAMRYSADAGWLREYLRTRWGKDWTLAVVGF